MIAAIIGARQEANHIGCVNSPRVALCADTYDEINGVATICREFVAYAQRHQLPLLVVRPGQTTRAFMEGSVTFVELHKSPLCIPLDLGLRFDLLIPRHYRWLRTQLALFAPDIIHITGPGDIGMLCAALSHHMRVPKIPLVAAWHTNVHRYACLRLLPLLELFPVALRTSASARVEAGALRLSARFYQIARLILRPTRTFSITSLASPVSPAACCRMASIPSCSAPCPLVPMTPSRSAMSAA